MNQMEMRFGEIFAMAILIATFTLPFSAILQLPFAMHQFVVVLGYAFLVANLLLPSSIAKYTLLLQSGLILALILTIPFGFADLKIAFVLGNLPLIYAIIKHSLRNKRA